MKNIPLLLLSTLFLVFASCQTRVVSSDRPWQANSVELYQKYTIQMQDAKIYKVQILRQDAEKIYAKTLKGEDLTLNKTDIREVKKIDLFSTIAVAVAAVAAVIFVPI